MTQAVYRVRSSHLMWHMRAVDDAEETLGGSRYPASLEFVTDQAGDAGAFPDITIFDRTCPVFQRDAYERLIDLTGGFEVVPTSCQQTELVALRVPVMSGLLDLDACGYREIGSRRVLWTAAFSSPAPALPGLFQVDEMSGAIFASDRFADTVRGARLDGCAFDFEWSVTGRDPSHLSAAHLRRQELTPSIVAQMDDVTLDDIAWADVCHGTDEDLVSMSDAVRAFYATRLFEWEVGNGGLHQFFFNHPSPETIGAVIEGYQFLGAPDAAAVVTGLIAPIADREREWRASLRDGSIETFMDSYSESLLPDVDGQVKLHDVERIALVRSDPSLFAF